MRIKTPKQFVLLAFLLLGCWKFVQGTALDLNNFVFLNAVAQTNPPRITLSWNDSPATTSLVLYRKAKNSKDWGTPLATWGKGVTQYTDANVQLDPFSVNRQLSGWHRFT